MSATAAPLTPCPHCGHEPAAPTDPCAKCGRAAGAGGAGGEAASAGEVFRRLGPAAWLGVVAAVLPALGGITLLAYVDPVGSWLREHDTNGVLLYAALFAVLSGFALLPTYAQAFLGGWAFVFPLGFPAAMSGFLGGSLIGYEVARRASGDRVERVIDEKPRWRAVRDALVGRGFWPTLAIVTLVRLPPNSPFALTNLVMASVQVGRAPFALGTLLGMAPRTAAAVLVGRLFHDVAASEALDRKPLWLLPVGIGSAVVVLLILGAIANRAVARVTAAATPAAAGAPEAVARPAVDR